MAIKKNFDTDLGKSGKLPPLGFGMGLRIENLGSVIQIEGTETRYQITHLTGPINRDHDCQQGMGVK